jgi:hypothetical protein
MKKYLVIVLISILFACSSSSKYVTVENTKLAVDMIEFLIEFEKASINSNSEKLLQLLDPEYREIQLEDFHRGKTDQFLNELFCGNDINKEGFNCFDYKTVQSIKFVKAENNADGYFVYYKVSDGENDILCSWLVTVKSINQKTVYGIYGALG